MLTIIKRALTRLRKFLTTNKRVIELFLVLTYMIDALYISNISYIAFNFSVTFQLFVLILHINKKPILLILCAK